MPTGAETNQAAVRPAHRCGRPGPVGARYDHLPPEDPDRRRRRLCGDDRQSHRPVLPVHAGLRGPRSGSRGGGRHRVGLRRGLERKPGDRWSHRGRPGVEPGVRFGTGRSDRRCPTLDRGGERGDGFDDHRGGAGSGQPTGCGRRGGHDGRLGMGQRVRRAGRRRRAGVHLSRFTERLYIHAKVIVVDGATAFVGSQNFSTSSLDDNRELGVITTDPVVVTSVSTTLAQDAAGAVTVSASVTETSWSTRSWPGGVASFRARPDVQSASRMASAALTLRPGPGSTFSTRTMPSSMTMA